VATLSTLPQRTAYDIPDPNRSVLDATLLRARKVHVTIEE
jgi:hypothetical protein